MTNFYTDADLAGAGEFAEAAVALATEFTLPAGTIASVRSRFPAVAGATVLMRIYNASNTLLASASAFDSTTVDAWNTATISGGLVVSAATYRVCIVATRYIALGGFFSGGSIARSSMTAVQGRFDSGDVAPASTSTATYFVDIDFTPAAAGGAVSFGAAPTLAAAATRVQPAAVSFGAAPTLAAAATRTQFAIVAFGAAPTLTAGAGALVTAVVSFGAAPALTATGTVAKLGAVSFGAAPALTAVATLTVAAGVAFASAPTLTAGALLQRFGAVVFTAAPVLTATPPAGPVAPYVTAVLAPGAQAAAVLAASGGGSTMAPSAAAPATLTAGTL